MGAAPCYYSVEQGAHAARAAQLVRAQPVSDWDLEGVRNYLHRAPDGKRTCFDGVQQLAKGESLWGDGKHVEIRPAHPEERTDASLLPLLEQAMQRVMADGKKAAVALSGGLDSALVITLLKRIGLPNVPVATLATGLEGYCELASTRQAAKMLGIHDLAVIEASGDALVEALPHAIRAAEAPLFNLHPVSRWLLAQALHREGFEVLITGDGADQLFAGSDPRNYVPIVGALTRESGLDLRSPFFDAALAASTPAPSQDKAVLREIATDLLPSELLARPKKPCYAPELDVSRHWQADRIEDLAGKLGEPPSRPGGDANATLWTTLGLLASVFD